MVPQDNMYLEYDSEKGEYYVTLLPVIVAAGKTRHEALEEVRMAAHFCIDTLVDLELNGEY